MSQDDIAASQNQIEPDYHEYFNLMLSAFDGESDRSVGIVSICLLDEQLEKLIRSYLVKDPQINSLFKDEH